MNRKVVELWGADAERFIRAESERLLSLKATGRTQRNLV
jgi:hypothetical protein